MNKLFTLLLACAIAQFSYGQKELTIKEMEDSVALGNLNVQVDLATEYILGEKVEQNQAKAYSLIRDAAEKGNRYGQLMLGVCYQDGIGVDKNLSESFNWFVRSAEQ
jgi:TPR repeat protein